MLRSSSPSLWFRPVGLRARGLFSACEPGVHAVQERQDPPPFERLRAGLGRRDEDDRAAQLAGAGLRARVTFAVTTHCRGAAGSITLVCPSGQRGRDTFRRLPATRPAILATSSAALGSPGGSRRHDAGFIFLALRAMAASRTPA